MTDETEHPGSTSDATGGCPPQTGTTRLDDVLSHAARDDIAAEWAAQLIPSSYVPLSRHEVIAVLREQLDMLLDVLAGARPLTDANVVGERLVRLHFTRSVVLSRSVDVLAERLAGLAPVVSRTQVNAVLAAFSAGYAGQLRELTLEQQENVKRAVLRARDQAEDALRASEARSRTVFESSAVGIAIADLNGVIDEVNPAMRRIFAAFSGDLVGTDITRLVDSNKYEQLFEIQQSVSAGDLDFQQMDLRFTGTDEREVWTQLSVTLVRDPQGSPHYEVLLYEDITDRHMLQEHFRRQATQDPLTGLANRTLLTSQMQDALQEEHAGRRVGLCFFDLDGFKAVNDSLGHPIGDELLRQVARRLQALTEPAGAVAARMGGDEFVVLVPDTKGADGLVRQVEDMLAEITRAVRIGGHELYAQASVGVVERPVAGTDSEQLLRDADITLYRAKSDGRAQWVLFDPEHNQAARDRFRLSADLPKALSAEELFVEYSPVRHLEHGRLEGLNVQVRWDHAEFGELDAAQFLGLAEETGMITRLGNWVLERVCEHVRNWIEELGDRCPIALVQLSERHCRDPEVVSDVRRILDASGVPADRLAFALPEAALFDSEGDPVDVLEIFADLGVWLVVHEFGHDPTRLRELRGLPLHAVRIGGEYLASFAAAEGPDVFDRHLVRNLTAAAQLLGLPVIASGVDTREQALRLHEHGVRGALGEHTGGVLSALEVVGALDE